MMLSSLSGLTGFPIKASAPLGEILANTAHNASANKDDRLQASDSDGLLSVFTAQELSTNAQLATNFGRWKCKKTAPYSPILPRVESNSCGGWRQ